jgi:hypothetical protein
LDKRLSGPGVSLDVVMKREILTLLGNEPRTSIQKPVTVLAAIPVHVVRSTTDCTVKMKYHGKQANKKKGSFLFMICVWLTQEKYVCYKLFWPEDGDG